MLIVTFDGKILKANHGATNLFGSSVCGQSLADVVATPAREISSFLRRCSGTRQPLIWTLEIPAATGKRKVRTYGSRLQTATEAALIALRLVVPSVNEFALLSRKLSELNAEIHQRRRTQAMLEETLTENRLLLNELHHRVRNNLQFMIGMISARRRKPCSAEVGEFIDLISNNLLAIGAVQQLMYQTDTIRTVSAAEFMGKLADTIGLTLGSSVRVEVRTVDAKLSNEKAFPLALILNELMTNATKHGIHRNGTIQVYLEYEDPNLVLTVSDDGVGMDLNAEPMPSSGLGLVRGLCRQIGAKLEFCNQGGLVCRVCFAG